MGDDVVAAALNRVVAELVPQTIEGREYARETTF